MKQITQQAGFSGQIQHIIPRPILGDLTRHILVSQLYPTDIGRYPRARGHLRRRERGAAENILILCTSGSGWFEIHGRRQSLQAGQMLLLPKDVPHAYGASARNPWSILWVHFLGDDAPFFFTLLETGSHVVPVGRPLMNRCSRLFTDAFSALSGGFTQAGVICAAQAIRHMLGLLFFQNRAFHPATKAPATENIERVLRFMRDHVDATLTVQAMAKEAGLSVTHFSRLFSRQTSFAPVEYFIHLKMQRACRFLTLTNASVKEIAAHIGYDDPYYFSRLFRKVMGEPPAHYRKFKLG